MKMQQPQQQQPQMMGFLGIPPPVFSQPPPNMDPAAAAASLQHQLTTLQAKLATIVEQIQQSEHNLKAQEEFLNAKKKLQIEELLKSKVNEKFNTLLAESSLNLAELEQITDKIVKFCTKDAISVEILIFTGSCFFPILEY